MRDLAVAFDLRGDEAALGRFAAECTRLAVAEGDRVPGAGGQAVLFGQGAAVAHARSAARGDVRVAHLGRGDMIGEGRAFESDGLPSGLLRVTATEPLDVWLIPHPALRLLLAEHPRTALHLGARIARAMHWVATGVLDELPPLFQAPGCEGNVHGYFSRALLPFAEVI